MEDLNVARRRERHRGRKSVTQILANAEIFRSEVDAGIICFEPEVHSESECFIYVEMLVQHLQFDKKPADRRSVLQILARLRSMERLEEGRMDTLERRLDEICMLVKSCRRRG